LGNAQLWTASYSPVGDGTLTADDKDSARLSLGTGQAFFEKLFVFSRDGVSVRANGNWLSPRHPSPKQVLLGENRELIGEFVEVAAPKDPQGNWTIRNDGSQLIADVIVAGATGADGRLDEYSGLVYGAAQDATSEASLQAELGKAVLSTGDLRQVPTAIAAILEKIVPQAMTSIALADESRSGYLRVIHLPGTNEADSPEEIYLPIEGTPEGWVYIHRQPLLLSQIPIDEGRRRPQLRAEVRTGCWIPITRQKDVVGTLFVGSMQSSLSEQYVLAKLQGLSSQIAGAIEVYDNFRKILEISERLREEKRYLGEELRSGQTFEKIVSKSQELTLVLKQVETVARKDEMVLIFGEPGTGKDLIARSIHQLSSRQDQPFIKINCSAVPRGLERKLFGFEKNAFPGAVVRRLGRLELAHMGTLYLDEVGDLPLPLQARLVAALQERATQRLGGRVKIPINVRIVATTNRDLARLVREGEFHSDLYQILMANPIKLPPLRRRATDIPLLVNYFVNKHAKRTKKWIDSVPRETMAALCARQWPGNVRELENFIERAVLLTPGSTLHAPLAELQATPSEPEAPLDPNLEAVERRHILRVLKETKGVIGGPRGAAAKLGLKRTTLNSKLKKLGIQKKAYS
jgi:formate hydrogenlyase transcriptional activator